jgi:hypothetical protein
LLRSIVMILLKSGGYRPIRQGLRELAYELLRDAGPWRGWG